MFLDMLRMSICELFLLQKEVNEKNRRQSLSSRARREERVFTFLPNDLELKNYQSNREGSYA